MKNGWRTVRGRAKALDASTRGLLLRSLLGAIVVIGVAKVVLAEAQREAFVYAYGVSEHLDMNSFLGQEIAKREAPGHLNDALFSLLCALLVLVLVRWVVAGAPWARSAAVVLIAIAGLNTLAYSSVPAPWWDLLMALVLVVLSAAVGLLLGLTPVVTDALERRDARALRR